MGRIEEFLVSRSLWWILLPMVLSALIAWRFQSALFAMLAMVTLAGVLIHAFYKAAFLRGRAAAHKGLYLQL